MRPELALVTLVRLMALLAVLALALAAPPSFAQTTTSRIQGAVTSGAERVDGAVITAIDTSTGFRYRAVSKEDGSFALAGLRPGTYEIEVAAPGYAPQTRTLQVLLGQSVSVDFDVTPQSVLMENVSVVEDVAQETRTSVVSTNVTTEQIELLPQNNRNFLNFAQLAPGVRVTDDEFNRQMRALGQAAQTTNVFIDGLSYKNDVLEGGVVGQDQSRGNPFPQNAVQEFQVLTQNYKAEYEKASTSVISALTKTGGNVWAGDLFINYQNKSMVERTFFQERDDIDKPDYKRFQGGFSIGGPIIEDTLTMFLSYERNDQERSNRVFLGGAAVPPGFDLAPFQRHLGEFTSPFESDLIFAKLSWQPTIEQTVDVSFNRRDETDIRSFGEQTSFESGEDVRITVDSLNVKHKMTGGTWFNEASVQWLDMEWNPTALDFSQPGRNYFGLLRVGGRDAEQRFIQERLAFRDDITFFFEAHGSHALKTGAVLSLNDYTVRKPLTGNPVFNFTEDAATNRSFDAPFEAFMATGDPELSTENKQIGLYVQDDWTVLPRLTLNLGLRWDYESDMINNDFVTPPEFVAAVENGIPAGIWNELTPAQQANYFSTGDSRDEYTDAFQPRVGFSYDFSGSGTSVLFGGAGRFYDRVLYNYAFDEKFREQWRTYKFCFVNDLSEAGTVRTDCPPERAIVWDPAFLSREALEGFLASGERLGAPQIFLIPNDLKTPYNDQFSLGYRHRLGNILGEITLSRVRGKNYPTYIFGNRDRATGNLVSVSPEFSDLLLATDDRQFWYEAMFLKLERPFTADARWGFTFAYTLSEAEQQGNDVFSLDYFTVQDYPKTPTYDDERHRVVTTGIYRAPWDVIVSANLILGSGLPFDVIDASRGFGFYETEFRLRSLRPEKEAFLIGDWWAFRQMDLRLQKTFKVRGRQTVGVSLEGFNIFNWDNFGCLEGFIPPEGQPNFGKPRCVVGRPRSYQVGMSYAF